MRPSLLAFHDNIEADLNLVGSSWSIGERYIENFKIKKKKIKIIGLHLEKT